MSRLQIICDKRGSILANPGLPSEKGAATALISMKGHSARVPHKNIRDLAGKPCFYWIVSALLDAKKVSHILIETDDDNIEEVSRRHFPDITVLRRPDRLKGDYVSMNPLIEYHLQHSEDEVFLQTHSTNPLMRPETIDRAIEAYFAPGDHDSLFAVTAMQTRLYWPDGRAVNHDPTEMLPTQELPPIYEENSCIYVFSRSSFAAARHRVGKTPVMFPTPPLESVDIDEEHDFAYCEFLMRRRLGCEDHC